MMDETGRLQNLVEQFVNETDIIKRRELVEKILSVICDVEGIKKYSRGPNIDASHLAILEKAFGEKFIGTNGANPNINAANVLNYIYEKIVDLYYCSMLGSLIYDHLQYIDTYVDDNNNVLFDLTLMNQKILYELKNEEISIHQFKDICSYIQILGWAVEDNGNMYHELRQFFKENADHYMDIIDNSVIDAFYGTEDDDNINSNIYSSVMIGKEGNDKLNAKSGNDYLIGNEGDDYLYGGDGNDILDGGTGDDVLKGCAGDDMYIFDLGSGQDIINEGGFKESTKDKVVFGKGLDPKDLIVSKDGNDMILSFKGIDDTVKIVSQYYKKNFQIETYEFIDGTILTIDDLLNTPVHIHGEGSISDNQTVFGTKSNYLHGSEKDDTINAYSGDDHIYGYGGNDVLNGADGNDVLDGGTGDDKLNGSSGDDTYIFKTGYGQDTINEGNSKSANDKVIFGEGISPDDIIVSRDSMDMILSVKDTEDSLRVYYAYYKDSYWIENYEFADGTIITGEEMISTPLEIHGEEKINDFSTGLGCRDNIMYGSEKDDTIYAYSGNDVLDGGKGDDILYGSSGDDTYIFNLGYGNDTINEESNKSTNDKVIFGKGITPDDIVVSRDGWDMILSIKDTEDSLRVYYAYYKDSYCIENYEFADGTIITGEEMISTPLEIHGEEKINDFSTGLGCRDNNIYGSEKDDTMTAYNGNDHVYGYGGNDTLNGNEGDDVLDGGIGDDKLNGGSGNDTYIFNLGYGQDTINEANYGSTNDKVIFGKGISPDDIIVSRDSWDMILSVKDTEDSLRVYYAYNKESYWIEGYEFADGTIITGEEMINKPREIYGEGKINDYSSGLGCKDNIMYGSEKDDIMTAYNGNDHVYGYGGNDTLNGNEGDDVLDGGIGDDILNGVSGNDTYIFNLGYGHDTINEQNSKSTSDKVIFGEGIYIDDIVLSRDKNDLVLSINESDSLRIAYHYYRDSYRIESYEFPDGTIAEIDTETMSFIIVVKGSSFDSETTVDEDIALENEKIA